MVGLNRNRISACAEPVQSEIVYCISLMLIALVSWRMHPRLLVSLYAVNLSQYTKDWLGDFVREERRGASLAAKFYGTAVGEAWLGGCSNRIFDRQGTLIWWTVGNFLPIPQKPMGVENTGEVLESRTNTSSMQQCCRRYTHASVDQSLECECVCRCTAKAFFYALNLACNNRLQYRFGVHPRLWSFIHFLQQEESLVLMRTVQIRSGNYRDKALPRRTSCKQDLGQDTRYRNVSWSWEIRYKIVALSWTKISAQILQQDSLDLGYR